MRHLQDSEEVLQKIKKQRTTENIYVLMAALGSRDISPSEH